MKRLLVIAIAGCGSSQAAAPSEPVPVDDAGRIREVATQYQQWGRVDDELRVAPQLCAAPPSTPPLRTSEAKDGPHATKRYWLYASDRTAYKALHVQPGFAIVKQSIDGAGRPADLFVMARGAERWIYGTVSADGQVTSAGQVETCIGCHVEATHDRLFGIRSAEDAH